MGGRAGAGGGPEGPPLSHLSPLYHGTMVFHSDKMSWYHYRISWYHGLQSLFPVLYWRTWGGVSRSEMRERSGSHQRRRVRARKQTAAGERHSQPARASPARTIAGRRSSAEKGTGLPGDAQTHTPGQAAGGAGCLTPFSTKLTKPAYQTDSPCGGRGTPTRCYPLSSDQYFI